jgi:hypothetical protein
MYKKLRGSYWLKEKLNNCTVAELCPYCVSWMKCLEKYVKKCYGRVSVA